MKKLENIPKTNIFIVPEGYFEKLPLSIQARVEASRPNKTYAKFAFQYALPLILLLVVTLFILRPKDTPTAENLLSTVSTEQLIAYLEENNLTTDDLLADMGFDDLSLEAIEEEVFRQYTFDSLELDKITDDFDLDNL